MGLLLPRHRKAYVVELKRRDRVAHAISYARAALSGVWRKDQEAPEGVRVQYSSEAVDHARNLLDQQEADWQALFSELGIKPLTLFYEDAIERPKSAVQLVADYLEVEIDPAAAVRVPAIEKQSEADPKHWADLYARRSRP